MIPPAPWSRPKCAVCPRPARNPPISLNGKIRPGTCSTTCYEILRHREAAKATP